MNQSTILSKIEAQKFWYDYIKENYGNKAKLWYIELCFINHIKSENFYRVISKDVKQRSYMSNYEVQRPLPVAKKGY